MSESKEHHTPKCEFYTLHFEQGDVDPSDGSAVCKAARTV